MGLIKSEDLLKQFESGGLFFQDAIRKKIQSMPEGIVRCKDCKWYDPSESLSTIEPIKYACKLFSIYHIPEYFCSVGERRTDATN